MDFESSVNAAEPGEPAHLQLTLLDGFTLWRDAKPQTVPAAVRRLLGFLALRRRPVLRKVAAEILWPDVCADRAIADLRTTLWRAHRSGLRLIDALPHYLRLNPDLVVDMPQRENVAHRLTQGGEVTEAEIFQLSAAGTLLPDWDEAWIDADRERFRQLRLRALEAACERLAGAGRFALGIEAGLAAVAAEPLRESARRALIVAHLAQGNQVEAIRQYSSYSSLLWDELRIKPSPAIAGLIDSVAVEAAARRSRARGISDPTARAGDVPVMRR